MQFDRISPNFHKLIPDFIKDYPDTKEEIDSAFPAPFGPFIRSTFLVDSDHEHDLKTRRSITILIGYFGCTSVIWYSKRHRNIASIADAAKFAAPCTATEEAQSLRYMLRCLGCNVPSDGSCPTRMFGDNLSVNLNSQNPAAETCDNIFSYCKRGCGC